ncbi:7 transmembrane receptor [Paragonimus heterotremus]|uniref:7 transmembrane receptor n=1 Tax=Paragonimus heterotremus TaxID=100268 RepID=A0A8J4TTR9_9TREM|nr:7 transmembrane receptor [Paragonimus heterotremus]
MFDVMLCSASILNLVAISMDRYVAVTKPIVYSRHSNSTRVAVTIGIAWVISFLIALPIACGLNNMPHRQPELCVLYNPVYIIVSSTGSFYIPFVVMIILYYRVFRAIRQRTQIKSNMTNGSKLKSSMVKRAPSENLNLPPPTTGLSVISQNCASSWIEDQQLSQNVECLTPRSREDNLGVQINGYSEKQNIPIKIEPDSSEPMAGSDNHSESNFRQTEERDDADVTILSTEPSTVREFQNMEDFRKHLRKRIRHAKRCSLSVLPVQYLGTTGQQVYAYSSSHSSKRNAKQKTKSKFKYSRSQRSLRHKSGEPTTNTQPSLLEQMRCTSEPLPATVSSFEEQTKYVLTRLSSQLVQPNLVKDKTTARREKKVTKTLAIVLGKCISHLLDAFLHIQRDSCILFQISAITSLRYLSFAPDDGQCRSLARLYQLLSKSYHIHDFQFGISKSL